MEVTTETSPYARSEATFVQEMVKLLKATTLPETSPEATVAPPKAPWWAIWRKNG